MSLRLTGPLKTLPGITTVCSILPAVTRLRTKHWLKPQLTYQAYNATIEGSLFNNDSPLTFNPEPLKASLQLGLKWATNRLNFGYAISYLTKELDNHRVTAHKYGTITLAYRFE